jgi:transcriptional regulator with XRE-family HTH domain
MLGDRVKQRRLELDLTQDQLAKASGLKQFHISQIERGGIVEVKTHTIRRLARALRTTTDFLLEMEEDGQSEMMPTALALA